MQVSVEEGGREDGGAGRMMIWCLRWRWRRGQRERGSRGVATGGGRYGRYR